ncbi:MAG: glycosyltransferase [Xanthobacteraceae bacterium]|nr:glycosyltransferase [Xanthobacteraceae bacterium]MBX3535050.1 glycosyltransferase [Xanthobacteraceae bacterium]
MISVVIPTLDSEREIVPTLAALVSGAAAGIVRDVVLADGGSSDETEAVADAAGCIFIKGEKDLGLRLREGARAAARGEWLLFLDPGGILEEGWIREVRKFLDTVGRVGHADRRAATFRLAFEGFGLTPRLAEATARARLTLTGRPRAEQGLLISKLLYQKLGGHQKGENAHKRLIAKLGRMRIVKLRTRVLLADPEE